MNDREINPEHYKTKKDFLKDRDKVMKKVLSKGPEFERRIKVLNLNINPGKYKCIFY
jgi:hypothetical protein